MEPKNNSFHPLTTDGEIPYIDGVDDNGHPSDRNGRRSSKAPKHGDDDNGFDNFLSSIKKWTFPWLLTLSLVQLGVYLNKLYQDSAAVAVYYGSRDVSYCIVSASCLFIPAIVYIVYMISLYIKDQEETEKKEYGTKVVNGLLLIPWQIKGRVELLHFCAQRVCQRRSLTSEEDDEKTKLQMQASVLEFFEEFYAGFIQLLLQLYIIIVSLDENTDSKALPGEIIGSVLSLIAMMLAVKRKDDGILNGTLSVIGWLSMMTSRCVAIALATTVIHGWMILVCLLHAVLVTFWLSSIAINSYCLSQTTFTFKKKTAMFFLVFTVFGLPSLIYWPIMFQLKKRKRPLIFLFLMLMENCLLFALWFFLNKKEAWAKHDFTLISIMAVGYIVGALFLSLYICCKPKRTDEVAYYEMKAKNAKRFGMYYEFCDCAFKLPLSQSLEDKLNKVHDIRAFDNPS